MPVYLFGTRRIAADEDGFAAALAAAHGERLRPRCLCLVEGIEMYVARLGDGFIAKRMPNTGSWHTSDCPSYEPPPEASGLGEVLGTAIKEDPTTGETTLRFDFTMLKLGGRTAIPVPSGSPDSVTSEGSRLSLRGLLHYLWDQAELTRWQPGFAGKRTWSTVRKHLLIAAENKIVGGEALRSRLYIPEVFSVEQRDALNARRVAQWSRAAAVPGRPQHLMLLIGEVKEIAPARYGYKAVIKHVPDQAFALDEQLYRRLGRRFDSELALWASADAVHMIAIATFGVSEVGIPTIGEISLMPVTPQWLPIEHPFERQLVEQLVADGRTFIKGLRYNLHRDRLLATAVLTDTGDAGSPMFVVAPGLGKTELLDAVRSAAAGAGSEAWTWRIGVETMPRLPEARLRPMPSQAATTTARV